MDVLKPECVHSYGEDFFCMKCGVELLFKIDNHNMSDINHFINKSEKIFSFEKELEVLDIPDNVKQQIIILSHNSNIITRKAPRKRLLYNYAYIAYLQLDLKFDPKKLGDTIGLKDCDYNQAIGLISGANNKYFSNDDRIVVPMFIKSPCDYLKSIIDKLNDNIKFKIDIESLTEKLQKALDSDKMLYENNPEYVAIAMIKYQLDLDGVKIPKFCTTLGISGVIVKKQIEAIKLALDT